MPRRDFGEMELVYEFRKNGRETLRASLSTYNGQRLADLRIWVAGDDGEIPTRKGLSVKVEQLPQLLEAVETLARAAA